MRTGEHVVRVGRFTSVLITACVLASCLQTARTSDQPAAATAESPHADTASHDSPAIANAAANDAEDDVTPDGARSGPVPSGTAASQGVSATARPATWAVAIAKPGLPNCFCVTPMLYRGAQPTAEGMRELQAMGIKTVLSLRGFHDDDDQLAGTTLAHERIRIKSWHAEDEDVERFLRIVTDPAKQPVFVHCQHGADRTGMMCAIYRMTVQGWTAEDAATEMRDGGYGFHPIWQNLLEYVRNFDVTAMKRRMDAGNGK